MATKRRKLVAFLLLAVIGGVITYRLLNQNDEPEYQGRSLSAWLEQYEESWLDQDIIRREQTQAAVRTAVRNIGTNALPYLVKLITYQPPSWRTTLRDKLPVFISSRRPVIGWLDGDSERRAVTAYNGFTILGTNAAGAIPALEALMKDSAKPGQSPRAICALGCIGAPAIPALKAALGDSKQPNRWCVVSAFGSMAYSHGTNICWPILVEALNHDDLRVRSEATNALRQIAREIPNTPSH